MYYHCEGEDSEVVNGFRYLGEMISKDGSEEAEAEGEELEVQL